MYSPTTRLLTVLEMLQSRREISGSEMARRLEVDERTVRRYIERLQEMGIPVEAERGPYGGYQLGRGFRLPPLMFTDAEAVALTLGLLAIREYQFPVDVASIEGALAKTERAMPEKLLKQAQGLQEAITFNVTPPPTLLQNGLVTRLSQAVQERQQVFLRYQAWNGDVSERAFDPYGIVFNEGYWYTAGFCHLREDVRTFRLDRVLTLEPLDETFERPADFDALAHVMDALAKGTGLKPIEVLLKTTMEKAKAAISEMLGTLEETPDGILLRRPPYQLEGVAHILISLDFPVKVIQPPELRELIRQLGERARAIIEETP
jgi:predicted DNA-binding transcriptional regulator YafY